MITALVFVMYVVLVFLYFGSLVLLGIAINRRNMAGIIVAAVALLWCAFVLYNVIGLDWTLRIEPSQVPVLGYTSY